MEQLWREDRAGSHNAGRFPVDPVQEHKQTSFAKEIDRKAGEL